VLLSVLALERDLAVGERRCVVLELRAILAAIPRCHNDPDAGQRIVPLDCLRSERNW